MDAKTYKTRKDALDTNMTIELSGRAAMIRVKQYDAETGELLDTKAEYDVNVDALTAEKAECQERIIAIDELIADAKILLVNLPKIALIVEEPILEA